MDFCFQLCGAVPLTSFIRFCARSMFPCSARPSVDPFPPAALPAFIGTMDRSDSLPLVCPPPFYGRRDILLFPEEAAGSHELPVSPYVTHATVSDPGGESAPSPLRLQPC